MLAASLQSKWLYSRFADSAQRYPQNACLELGGHPWSYRTLLADSTQTSERWARHFDRWPGCIALYARRADYGTIVRYLAILRLGCAVVPLGPDWPSRRLHTVIRDSGADYAVGLPESIQSDLSSEDFTYGDLIKVQSNPTHILSSDIQYVLFTSGSTGRPKGVPIGESQVEAYIDRALERYQIEPTSRMSQNFSLTFDLSIFDLFCAWAAGATVCMPKGQLGTLIAKYVQADRLTHWFGVPSAIAVAYRLQALAPGSMPSLRVAMTCGEKLTWRQADLLATAAPQARILNLYGPTELTISVSDYECIAGLQPETPNGIVPIGNIHSSHHYVIIDQQGRDTSEGELCLAGPQKFAGYLDPVDNIDRFLTNINGVWRASSTGEFYRTGDRVRSTQDGICYLGRTDSQVKVAGHRVELGEVEAALRVCDGVIDAVVVILEDRHAVSSLAAAVMGANVNVQDVKEQLSEILPPYMVPRRIASIQQLPRTEHGKTDQSAVIALFGEKS